MLLPGGQTPHAVAPSSAAMPSFGVPCMFLPSPGLGPFPVLYSPAIPGPISSAPGTLPNTGPMNFGLSTLASASHLLISPAAMVNPKSSTLPSADPQLRCQPPLNPNPVMPGSHGVIHPESPGYMRHPVSMVKAEQSPAPATPKSIQRRHRETFFKTPGSLGDPAFRRERNQSRNTSSAQRRLEISSSGPD